MSRIISEFRRKRGSRLAAECALVSGALLLLIAFGAFAVTPLHPYFSGSASAWHVSKASKSGEAGVEGAGDIPAAADQPQLLLEASSEGTPIPDPEVPFLMLPRLLHSHFFRPPPLSLA